MRLSRIIGEIRTPRSSPQTSLEEAVAENVRDGMPETGENVAEVFGVTRADQDAFAVRSQQRAIKSHGLTPLARIAGGATAGVAPRIMGFGLAPASRKRMARLGIGIEAFDVIELNEAFASQALAVLRDLGIADDAPHVNPNGGAIALGHPLGASGARLAGTSALELALGGGKHALATMCIGVGQGISLALERAGRFDSAGVQRIQV